MTSSNPQDLTLDALRTLLEYNARKYPQLEPLAHKLEAAVREFWDAEEHYIGTVRLLAGEDAAEKIRRGGPYMWHLSAQEIGGGYLMLSTKADLRAVLDAIARYPIPATECIEMGERIFVAWAAAETELRAVGLLT